MKSSISIKLTKIKHNESDIVVKFNNRISYLNQCVINNNQFEKMEQKCQFIKDQKIVPCTINAFKKIQYKCQFIEDQKIVP